MKIGILESPRDTFINDVISLLGGLPVEFLSFSAERVPIGRDYRVIVDRLSFRDAYLQELMKVLSLKGSYVINNPFAATATNKVVEADLCGRLGIPYPKTLLLPGQTDDALRDIVAEPLWESVAQEIGLPCVIKPYNGSGWQDVYIARDMAELQRAYRELQEYYVPLAQQFIDYKEYYRVFCIQGEVLFVKWIPKPLGMGEYLVSDLKSIEGIKDHLAHKTRQLNSTLDLDINVVEWCLDKDEQPWVIEAYNEVPDIDKRSIPSPYYEWLVDRFAHCIRDKYQSQERNKAIFLPG